MVNCTFTDWGGGRIYREGVRLYMLTISTFLFTFLYNVTIDILPSFYNFDFQNRKKLSEFDVV